MSRRPTDAGMSIVEVMVALVLFAILGTAIAVSVNTASRLAYEDNARTAATNLAVREIEIARDTFFSVTRGPDRVRTNRVVNPSPLPGGAAGAALEVDGTKYTVVRTAQWASTNAVASACDEGSSAELSMLRVDVEVTWPDLGGRPPVRMSTLMSPPKGTYSVLTGHIGLRVIDRNGSPIAGATVSARSSAGALRTGDTAADGCVLLSHLDAGTWTLTLNRSAHVNPVGDPSATTTATVVQGQLWRGTIEYDQEAWIDVTFTTLSGWALPPGINAIPVSLGNSGITPSGSRAVSGTGNVRRLRGLWPYPSGYQLWAGACVDNDPGDFRTPPVDAVPGGAAADARVALAPLTVRAPANTVVTATHASDSACSSGVTVNLGSSGAGELRTSLPYGLWRISRTSGSGSTTRNVTLVAPDPADPTVVPEAATVDVR
jgi:prepilin-type N-terminal cleavage/methylation domain-containing protein